MINNKKKQQQKNCLSSVWFICKKISWFMNKVLGAGVRKIRVVSGFELEIEVLSKNLYPIILFLNKHTFCRYKSLIDIICYDVLNKSKRFVLVYNLLSYKYGIRLRVVTRLVKFYEVLSMLGIYRVAGWCEREVFDFFGIFFFKNYDLRRILTDYGFKGFPLRKDFPLTGFVDVYYDDNQKRICYRTVELAQEYRHFKLKTNWYI